MAVWGRGQTLPLSNFPLSCSVRSPFPPGLPRLVQRASDPLLFPAVAPFGEALLLGDGGQSVPSLDLSPLIYHLYSGLNQWLPNLVLHPPGGSFKNAESWASPWWGVSPRMCIF